MSEKYNIDITEDLYQFIKDNSITYTELENIFKGLCWRLQRDDETYYHDNLDLYFIKSNGDFCNIFLTLVIKKDNDTKIIISAMIEEKNTGNRIIHKPKNKL